MNCNAAAKAWPALLALLAVALFAGPVLASEGALEIAAVQVGLGGVRKLGHMTPVRVVLRGGGPQTTGRLVLRTPDSDGQSVRYADAASAALPTDGATPVTRFVVFGNAASDLTVELYVDDRLAARRVISPRELPPAASSTSELIVTLGADVGAAAALKSRSSPAPRDTHAVVVDKLSDMPPHHVGWEAIDLLILPTHTLAVEHASTGQWQALAHWLHQGGRCVISVGSAGNQLLGANGPLAPLLPGKFNRVAPLRRTAALEAYTGAPQRLGDAQGPQRVQLDLAVFDDVRGRVELTESLAGAEVEPLVIHYSVGLGQVTLLAVDIEREPLQAWSGRPKLLARLMAPHHAGETGKTPTQKAALPAQLGYQDLSGQLRMALDQFNSAALLAFSWIALCMAAYVAWIGPGDYFLVRRVLGRPHLTWITLTLAAVATLAGARWLQAWMKAPRVQVNQAEVIDWDLATGTMRGQAWTHIYSPTAKNFDLRFERLLPTHRARGADGKFFAGQVIGWEGLPGTGLGGVDGRSAPNLFDSPYTLAAQWEPGEPAATADAMSISTSSTKAVVTRWWDLGPRSSETQLRRTPEGLLAGEFTQPLGVPLLDAAILYENWIYRSPKPLAPGQKIDVDKLTTPRNLLWQLTQKRLVGAKDIVTPWDVRSVETPRILEIMMFHKAAGGDNYTTLTQRFAPQLDLSDHLKNGQAILLGRSERRTVTLHDGEASCDDLYGQSWTYHRVILPVANVAPP